MTERDPYSKQLEPLGPADAYDWWLEQAEDEYAPSTLRAYRSRVMHLIEFCEAEGIENLNELTGRDLFRFRTRLKKERDLNDVSLKGKLTAVRSFVKWCESINACSEALHRDVVLPSLDYKEDVRDNVIDKETMDEILDYLNQYEYASFKHALLLTAWETHLRTGSLHSLDVEDLDRGARQLTVQHRPETDTRLKNGSRGNRVVALSENLTSVLSDYIAHQRPSTEGEHSRRPLFASEHGRMSKSNLRQACYGATRPCQYTNECPHGREMNREGCKAVNYSYADSCPSSESLHAVRRGGITWRLSEDVPISVVSDRANVSQRTLERHYDARHEAQKSEQRREHLNLDKESEEGDIS